MLCYCLSIKGQGYIALWSGQYMKYSLVVFFDLMRWCQSSIIDVLSAPRMLLPIAEVDKHTRMSR